MATVTKGIYIASGGVFRHSTAVTTTEFTTASNQYAIVTLTNLYFVGTSASGTASSANVNISGTIIAQAVTDGLVGSNATVVKSIYSAAGSAVPAVASQPFEIYVGPSQAFQTVIGAIGTGNSAVISGTYVIFQNT